MNSEEIAQSRKRSDCFDIGGWFGILDGFQLVLAWFDSFGCEHKSKVRNLLVSEDAFLQVYFQIIFVQAG